MEVDDEDLADLVSQSSSESDQQNPDDTTTYSDEESSNSEPSSLPSVNQEQSERTNVDRTGDPFCTICFDTWENGDHRLCVLKCGHIFGYCCIFRWLTGEGKTCPSCKAPSSVQNIRFLYLKKLIVTDYTELGRLKEELRKIKEEQRELEVEHSRVICRENALKQRAHELKKYAECLTKALEQSQPTAEFNARVTANLYLDKSIELCCNGGCRVLDYCRSDNALVASIASVNPLFPGFGVRKIDVETYKRTAYIALHSKAIRDVRVHSEMPRLLSVSLDKTAKVSDTTTDSVVTYHCDSPLWSCSWDNGDSNYLYVGTNQGSVKKLDIRQFTLPVATMETPGDKCPVLAIVSIPPNSNEALPNGGLITCKLNSVWLFEGGSQHASYSLPLEGPFTYMIYDFNTQQFLVSSRPNSRCSYSRHYLCRLHNTPSGLSCLTSQTVRGSTVQTYLSRSSFVTYNSNQFVAAYQESEQNFCLWDVNTARKVCSAVTRDPIFDICNVKTSNSNFVVSLTEKKIMFHKFA
ncbi:hypothetical protein PPYR_11113 [Photinus pyralis]|uniref:RING-type E3 ubiquitin transferase n=1 Tax=Photinus pyralis TaxID=7054 RepID=A0A1Y1KC92_PHOPY|nr:E3 ubiquitin-protein ligase RFWD3-like [Photinus pyralis]KAB0797052.1 hypothetical protein PPYR_11113 [Photinus pyralis]